MSQKILDCTSRSSDPMQRTKSFPSNQSNNCACSGCDVTSLQLPHLTGPKVVYIALWRRERNLRSLVIMYHISSTNLKLEGIIQTPTSLDKKATSSNKYKMDDQHMTAKAISESMLVQLEAFSVRKNYSCLVHSICNI